MLQTKINHLLTKALEAFIFGM